MDEELNEAIEKLQKNEFGISSKGDVQVSVGERTLLIFQINGSMIRLIGNSAQVVGIPEGIKKYLN